MKKNLIFGLTIVSALFAACSSDEIVDIASEKSITFRTLVDNATRANVASAANLTAFKVTALHGNDIYFDMGVNKTGGNWVTEATHYWPGDSSLKFFAYANGPATDEDGTVTINKDNQKITGFAPKQKLEEQKDLLVAYNEGSKSTFTSGTVPLNFRHALAQIEVNAKNAKPTSVRVEVAGIKLVNLGTKADLTLPSTTTKDKVTVGSDASSSTNTDKTLALNSWANLEGANTPAKAYYKNKVASASPLTLTDKFQSLMFGSDNFMVLPQALTPWNESSAKTGAYLAVLCRISNKSGENYTVIYPQPKAADNGTVEYAYVAIPMGKDTKDGSLLPGKKYVYNLVFCPDGGGAGKIDPNPNNPGGGTDTDEEPGTGGEDVLGEISFSVSVDDFVPVNSIDVNL